MNARMSRHLTLLGLCSMAFYGAMLATGTLSLEVMPQFVVSALIFLTSGRLCKRPARARGKEESGRRPAPRDPADWELLTGLLNWGAAMLVLGVMALFIMKPVGVGFSEALARTVAQEQHFFAGAIP